MRSGFSVLGIWAFSIGTSIGWGSFIVTCSAYLQKAGILGTVFGLLAGMAVVLVITWNLQHMIINSPDAGGIYTFEKRIGSKDLGFLAAWFVLLTYLAVLWANVTSVPLFARFFLGDTFRFGFHYQIFGYEVWLGEALLSISAYPPEYQSWLDYIRDMGNLSGIKAVPAFYAIDHYLGQVDVDSHIRQEKEYAKRLEQAQIKASVDALTGVRNRHAYLDAEEKLNRLIAERKQPGFAITVFDVNDLKTINDNEGHHAGDMYLRSACKIICDIFKHSQVFRIGGDEFAVISQNEYYDRINELIGKVNDHNASAIRTGGIVIACGMAEYRNDYLVASVFDRADRQMYMNKNYLKKLHHPEA